MGDIDYHADNADSVLSFFDFTLEEVKGRYLDFLHLGIETEQAYDQDGTVDSDHEEPESTEETEGTEGTEDHLNKEVDDNLLHEVEELKGESIQAAYADHEYWKPQVDYNMEDLLREMNQTA